MRILIDTNILLDVLCDRKDFLDDALKIFKLCEAKRITGYISALSVPNIVYIMRKVLQPDHVRDILSKLTSIFSVVDLRASDLTRAAELPFSDYEDAIQAACATRIKADYIVTRNIKDFKHSPVQALKPSELTDRL